MSILTEPHNHVVSLPAPTDQPPYTIDPVDGTQTFNHGEQDTLAAYRETCPACKYNRVVIAPAVVMSIFCPSCFHVREMDLRVKE